MRTRTAQWYLTKIHYDKTMEDGNQKNVTEQYVVDALSCSEAESSLAVEMSHYVSGEYEITDINRTKYNEIFFSDNGSDDKWYKATLKFITIDEKTEKEKRTTNYYLVQANSFDTAKKYINDVMSGTMIDYEIYALTETAVMDVFEHDNSGKPKKDEKKDEKDEAK